LGEFFSQNHRGQEQQSKKNEKKEENGINKQQERNNEQYKQKEAARGMHQYSWMFGSMQDYLIVLE